jgi:hypothetical protein
LPILIRIGSANNVVSRQLLRKVSEC